MTADCFYFKWATEKTARNAKPKALSIKNRRSLLEKSLIFFFIIKAFSDEDINMNLSSDFEDIGAINRDFEKPLITTMIKEDKSQDSPNLKCNEILKFKDSELTLLDENFY